MGVTEFLAMRASCFAKKAYELSVIAALCEEVLKSFMQSPRSQHLLPNPWAFAIRRDETHKLTAANNHGEKEKYLLHTWPIK